MNPAPGSRRGKIIAIARREVDPVEAVRFAPITRGPIINGLGVVLLGSLAIPYKAGMKLAGLLRRKRP